MTGAKRDNIVFLPQTVRFYEEQLAAALQAERYAQAVQMLNDVLSIQGIDAHKRREWERLLDGIKTMFPEFVSTAPDLQPDGDDSGDEETFRIAALSRKMNEDPGYADRLIERLRAEHGTANIDDQLLVLEQLAHSDSPKADEAVKDWLSERERHPLLQFRALQTLKLRGVLGDVVLPRAGASAIVTVQDVPFDDSHLPKGIDAVFHMLRHHCEGKYPTLGGFLPDIERDFLAYAYGTELYREMGEAVDPLATRMWAAALHAGLQRNIFHLENVAEICREYEIPGELLSEWRRIFSSLELLFADMFEGRI